MGAEMIGDAESLRAELRAAGLSRAVVEAAWPEWWSNAAESSISARTELRLAVARNLGLSPKALVGERVDFVWRDRARFKHLKAADDMPVAALNSFGVSVGRSLIEATERNGDLVGLSPAELRAMLLEMGPPDLRGLLTVCWAIGVPVAHLRVWPLAQKAMHAMVVGQYGRHAILFSRESSYPAMVAFTLAHEIGHVALGHVPADDILVDVEDPAGTADHDDEEAAADRYALEVLLGDQDPDIRINFDTFNHVELADAVMRAGIQYGIDPGTLALAVAHKRNAWPIAMAAMHIIHPERVRVSELVNRVAATQLDLERLGSDSASFIERTLGIGNG
jgi:hypothetical protein